MSKLSVDKSGNIQADEAFLKAFADKGGKISTDTGSLVDNVDEYLAEVGKDQKGSTKKAEDLHKQVEEKTNEEIKKEKELEKLSKKEQDAIKKAEDQAKRINKNRLSSAEKAINIGKKAIDPILNQTGKAVDNFARARTVGGIGLLLFILIFLLFIVVEVNANGDTRIKQLWYMLVGRAQLIGRKQLTTNIASKTSTYNPDISSLQDVGNLSQDISKGNAVGVAQDIAGLFNDTTNTIFQTFRTGF